MIADVVLHAPQKHECRHKQDRPAVCAQYAPHLFQTGNIVVKMLNHIKSRNQVKRIVLIRQRLSRPLFHPLQAAPATKLEASAETSTPSGFPNCESISRFAPV